MLKELMVWWRIKMHGIIFGYFCPMYKGHWKLIEKARQECDGVSVVVCGYDGDDKYTHLPVEYRARLVAQELQHRYRLEHDIPETLCFNLTKQNIPDSRTLNNWRKFTDAIVNSIYCVSTPFKWYVDEPYYVKPLLSLGYDVDETVLDKSKYPVQLNELMDNPARYIDLITESFVSYWYRKYHHE